jgi:ribonucleoside-diphosphate reductase alpha chain
MWNNRNSYSGISVLPHDGGTYRNAPFEEVSDEVFNRKVDYINNNEIDLTMIIEEIDNTTQSDSAACAGGACEIV